METNNSLNIAQLITGSEYIGGAETHVRELVFGLQAHGHRCVVLCGPPDGLFCAQLRERGIQVRILSSLRKKLSAAPDTMAFLELVRELRRLKPDIVAAHTAKAAFLGRLAAAAAGIPCVATPHGLSIVDRQTGEIRKVFVALERFAGVFATSLITVCDHERSLAVRARIADPRKLAVVHNGITDGTDLADPGREPVLITMVARFEAPKDYDTLLCALRALGDCVSWKARLIGSGSRMEAVRALAEKLEIAPRVDFAGECADTARALADSQIFVLSTRMEAFPMSILEAMRAGLPVVASRVGGVAEAVDDGVTGLLAPPSDHLALAGRIGILLSNPGERKRMGANGRASYLRNFTAAAMVSRTLGVYSEALTRYAGIQTGGLCQSVSAHTRQSENEVSRVMAP